jgi:crotonobetainyl-CoA:carnitine CoA-transferase CaiB-like acyl-CoA transferase
LVARTALDWEARLTSQDLGGAAVSMAGHGPTISFDAGLLEGGLTFEYEHPLHGPMVRWAPPIEFSSSATRHDPPCQRGEHNRSILRELAYDETEIAELEQRHVIFPISV